MLSSTIRTRGSLFWVGVEFFDGSGGSDGLESGVGAGAGVTVVWISQLSVLETLVSGISVSVTWGLSAGVISGFFGSSCKGIGSAAGREPFWFRHF